MAGWRVLANGADMADLAQLLEDVERGDGSAVGRLIPLIYDDLKRLARRQRRFVRADVGDTLNTTGLVHEAFLKLADQSAVRWESRVHFFNLAARAMRQIIVDAARQRRAVKRGGGVQPETLGVENERAGTVEPQIETALAVDAALGRLADIDERLVRLVECRFFAGLTDDETALALGLSRRTVQRDWARARAWLLDDLTSAPGAG